MNAELNTKVGELVMERPETMRYFERLGIDYCCGGHRSLGEACALAKQDPALVLADLATLEPPSAGPAWERGPSARRENRVGAAGFEPATSTV